MSSLWAECTFLSLDIGLGHVTSFDSSFVGRINTRPVLSRGLKRLFSLPFLNSCHLYNNNGFS